MQYSLENFVGLSLIIAVMMSTIIAVPIAIIVQFLEKPFILSVLIYVVMMVLLFILMMKLPYYNYIKTGDVMEAEAAVVGRRLLIMLESGKSLVNALAEIHVKCSLPRTKTTLQNLSLSLLMGKPLEEVVARAASESPSLSFRKIFIHINNSLRTGSNIKTILKVSLDEITREKLVEFETFGKRLSPLGLFYMIFGTIMPSLGVVAIIFLLAILRITINYQVLFIFLLLIMIVQLFFIAIFYNMRPRLEI